MVVGGRRTGNVDLVGGEGGQVEPYNYTPHGVAGAGGPPMSEAGTGSVLGAGAAGLGAGMMAGGSQKRPPQGSNGPPSAPSAYSSGGGSQSHYAPSSSDPGGYDYAAYAAYSDPHSGSMSGHGGYDSTSPRSSAFPGGFNPAYGPAGEGMYRGGPSPGPSLPGTGSSSAGGMTLPSSKEMEARGLRVANEGGGESSGFVQHQDAGRLPSSPEGDESAPNEIPPSYDSIRD
jgi:hypothetical protein